MKIRMLQQVVASPDGINARTLEEGEEYEVLDTAIPHWMADAFLADGRAEEVKPKVVVESLSRDSEVSVESPKVEETPKRVGKPPGPSAIKKR